MRVITPQIVWHNKEPILSIAVDPSTRQVGDEGFYRIATGGFDSHLLVWHLKEPDTFQPSLTCVSDLTRHTKPINVVRFSPDGKYMASADDESYILIWQLEAGPPPALFGEEEESSLISRDKRENWVVKKNLRRHIKDIIDISWSVDGQFLGSCSVDNTAVLWDIRLDDDKKIKNEDDKKIKANVLRFWDDHRGLVQGISVDPANKYVATICTDRNLRIFDMQEGPLVKKTAKYPPSWLTKDSNSNLEVVSESEKKENEPQTPQNHISILENQQQNNQQQQHQESHVIDNKNSVIQIVENGGEGVENIKKPSAPVIRNRLFHDDTLKTFCRRLCFSPKGEFLCVPGGILPPQYEKSSTTDDSKKSDHCVVVFCRNTFTVPCAVIPTGLSYSIAVSFCPVYFKRKIDEKTADILKNSVKKGERMVSCVGNLNIQDESDNNVLLNMPYRLVFAILTNDSVLICDTISNLPIARVKNIHLARHSDLHWSPDGRVLLVTANDGYTSIITFADGELVEQESELLTHGFARNKKELHKFDKEFEKGQQKVEIFQLRLLGSNKHDSEAETDTIDTIIQVPFRVQFKQTLKHKLTGTPYPMDEYSEPSALSYSIKPKSTIQQQQLRQTN